MTHYSAAAVAVLCATASALVRQSLASNTGETARRLRATSSGTNKSLYRTLASSSIIIHKRVMILRFVEYESFLVCAYSV